jgi:hypothetical protein
MTPKDHVNYFILGNVADTAITYLALHKLDGFKEIGIAGNDLAMDEPTNMFIFKIASTALIVGVYALTRGKNVKKEEYVGRKAMEFGTAAVYLILVTNILQVFPEVLRMISENQLT